MGQLLLYCVSMCKLYLSNKRMWKLHGSYTENYVGHMLYKITNIERNVQNAHFPSLCWNGSPGKWQSLFNIE